LRSSSVPVEAADRIPANAARLVERGESIASRAGGGLVE
jgi:hypothetical protein